MKRIIKFRAWNKERKAWRPLDGTDELSVLNDDAFNICQFTGLKDKNGKEIFEGDIIDNGNGATYVFYNENYHAFWVGFDSEETEKQFYRALWDYEGDIEILGNIYENPELLTVA